MNEDEIQKLSIIEQNLSSIVLQKQNFQKKVFEIDNALEEMKNKEYAYQIAGPVMIKKNSKELIETLKQKKETLVIRVEKINQQEKLLREEMNKLHQTLLNKEN